MLRALSAVATCVLLAACGDRLRPPEAECRSADARLLCELGDPMACEWAELVESGASLEVMARVVGLPDGSDRQDILRALWTELGELELAAGAAADPAELGPITIDIDRFEPVTVELPIDWRMDPYADPSWRLFFHSLVWIERIPARQAGAVLADWARATLFEPDAPFFAWDDHAIALRIHHVGRAVSRHIEAARSAGTPASEEVLWSAAILLATHLYALGTGTCYTPQHNHGVMQDRAVLRTTLRYPALEDGDELARLAAERFEAQVHFAVTAEGVHAENSPGYHLFFMQLVQEMVELLRAGDGPVPPALAEVPERMAPVVTALLQPNLTFPQFGDTENSDAAGPILALLERLERDGAGEAVDQLRWVASRGATGIAPTRLDAVYPDSGYAAFRSSWTAHDQAITGHFTCGRVSDVHYHQDETSVSIYGYGQELIVDPGLLDYRADPLTRYSRSVAAHNVVTIDGHSEHDAAGEAFIEDFDTTSPELVWVRGGHTHFEAEGVEALARTFAHAKPDIFLIADHLRATGAMSVQQHLLLHPALSTISQPNPHRVVAAADDGPTLVVSALPGQVIELRRGIDSAEGFSGFYFPGFGQVVETTELVIHHDLAAGDNDLPLLLHVLPEDDRANTALDSFERTDTGLRFGWSSASGDGEASLPVPEDTF